MHKDSLLFVSLIRGLQTSDEKAIVKKACRKSVGYEGRKEEIKKKIKRER
jgi:hypothetical protein